jgi:lipopolysaccharide biosynthesis protein
VYNDASQTPTHRTAVMFAFNEASTEDAATLSYFLDAAVWPSESIDFFIIVNGEYCSLKNHPKLNLPNIKYMQRENEGFDFAAYNYALSSFELSDYAYFIFLNSGVRGT